MRTQIAVFKIILGKVLLNSVVFIGISVGCKYYCLRKWQISSNGLKIYGIRSELENTKACNLIKKETLAQVLSCEFCEISKNMFFYRTPPVAASVRNKCLFLHLRSLELQTLLSILSTDYYFTLINLQS